jgi:hypothetical protein
LESLDRWYREQLAGAIASRSEAHLTLDELVAVTEWKMKRGVWRARNLVLVKSNPPAEVAALSRAAIEGAPHPTQPISRLCGLAGVGPATASAVLAAVVPDVYPFFDELVASQVPHLGQVVYTLGYYSRYAEALRQRASHLGREWTPALVERALWAHAGGKAARPVASIAS